MTGSRTASVRVAAGQGVDLGLARQWLDDAAATWSSFGVELDVAPEVEALTTTTLLPTTRDDLEQMLGHAGLSSETAPPEVVLSIVLSTARELLAERHRAGDDLHIVLLSRLAPPDGVMRQALPGLDGLTLAQLPLPPEDPRAPLVAAIDLETWTPTVFVGVDDVRQGGPPLGQVIAHEVGHALGLAHVRDPANLMASQRSDGCRPVLTERQLLTIGTR